MTGSAFAQPYCAARVREVDTQGQHLPVGRFQRLQVIPFYSNGIDVERDGHDAAVAREPAECAVVRAEVPHGARSDPIDPALDDLCLRANAASL